MSYVQDTYLTLIMHARSHHSLTQPTRLLTHSLNSPTHPLTNSLAHDSRTLTLLLKPERRLRSLTNSRTYHEDIAKISDTHSRTRHEDPDTHSLAETHELSTTSLSKKASSLTQEEESGHSRPRRLSPTKIRKLRKTSLTHEDSRRLTHEDLPRLTKERTLATTHGDALYLLLKRKRTPALIISSTSTQGRRPPGEASDMGEFASGTTRSNRIESNRIFRACVEGVRRKQGRRREFTLELKG